MAIDLDDVLGSGALVPSFQPIVEPSSGAPHAFEALARWPGVEGASPATVFPAAAAAGRLAELDWECRLAAIRAALEVGLNRSATLFVNVEASTFGHAEPADAPALFEAARERLHVMLELTERSLLRRPADLLRLTRWARERGFGIALDDVGAEPESLAMLPFVAPDVIKLDLALVQQTPSRDQARTVAAVLAHAEETGASILAEGIETAEQLEQALALGARYCQGWYFGRPGPLTPQSGSGPLPLADTPRDVPDTPFELARARGGVQVARKKLLLAMSHHVEGQATAVGDPPVVLAAFQSADRFTASTLERYSALAEGCPFVGALGVGLAAEPAPGVRGASLSPQDSLANEWTVVVVGAHYSGALIARDMGDSGPEDDRRFEFLITHDRPTVLAAGRSLMRRVSAI